MSKQKYFSESELKLFSQHNPIFNESQMKIINRKTPKSQIEEKTENGITYKSVKASYVKALVNLVTGGNYSFIIKEQSFLSSSKEIRTTASLTIYSNNKAFTREQNGKSECTAMNANSFKASASDAFKKCASEFGFCWDIYSNDITEPEKESSPELTHKEKTILDRVDTFLSECKSLEDLEFEYNKAYPEGKETIHSKLLLEKHLNRLGYNER